MLKEIKIGGGSESPIILNLVFADFENVTSNKFTEAWARYLSIGDSPAVDQVALPSFDCEFSNYRVSDASTEGLDYGYILPHFDTVTLECLS